MDIWDQRIYAIEEKRLNLKKKSFQALFKNNPSTKMASEIPLSSFRELTVIIPTLNEYDNIGKMISKLLERYKDISILVSDDGSKDGTAEVIVEWSQKNPRIQLLDRKGQPVKGLSISIVDAVKIVKTPYFFVIDCDFQHPPDRIEEGFALMVREDFPLVIGTRRKVKSWSITRKVISWGASTLGKFSLMLRRRPRPKDIMSGFFGGKTEFVSEILVNNPQTVAPKGYKILFDLLKVIPRNARVGEFFYTFKGRDQGTSKMGKKQMMIFFRSLF
ncbi:MAG: glycosyltransferase, partial [Candidatus Thorarchaeota archaeon]